MSVATETVTGRVTVDVESLGHCNISVAIPGLVTGDVAVPGPRTGSGVNLGHGTGVVAFPRPVIVTGKLPGQVPHFAAVPGNLQVPL